MNKTDWELRSEDGRQVLTRNETPMGLWLLDRWFRVPDVVFDRVEWWFPRTSAITRLPCLLYSRWAPEFIIRQTVTVIDVTEHTDEDAGSPPN